MPTENVPVVSSWASILTLVTVLNAEPPLTVALDPVAKRKASEITLPSMLVPVTVTTESWIADAVPPAVTLSALGTSGSLNPDVIVWSAPTVVAEAAKIAVAVPAAIFF